MNGYWFTSTLFQIEPGEDAEINPGRYGRQLAIWLKGQLEHRGYSVEPIINEDWRRCLMCSRDPFMLWVGCGNVSGPRAVGDRSSGEARCVASFCRGRSSLVETSAIRSSDPTLPLPYRSSTRISVQFWRGLLKSISSKSRSPVDAHGARR